MIKIYRNTGSLTAEIAEDNSFVIELNGIRWQITKAEDENELLLMLESGRIGVHPYDEESIIIRRYDWNS